MNESVEMVGDPDSLQRSLLNSLERNNYDEFESILRHILPLQCFEDCNLSVTKSNNSHKLRRVQTVINIIDHLYEDHKNKTLLDIACSLPNRVRFVDRLLKLGAEVNRTNTLNGAPIHLAILYSDYETVKLLVEHEETDIHRPNAEGYTPFHLAAQQGRSEFLKLLQDRQAEDIEKGKRKFSKNESRLTRNTDNTSNHLLSRTNEPPKYNQGLARLIYQNNYEEFERQANADNVLYGGLECTYLQYACELGRTEFVQHLLNLKVNPNETTIAQKETPIIIAAYHGYHDIVQLLLDTGIIIHNLVFEVNVLHFIMRGFYSVVRTNESLNVDGGKGQYQANRDYIKCLELVLNNVPDSQLDVNLADPQGNTPLFYAIVLDEREMILKLLERGAYIGVQAWSGFDIPLIKLIQPATLEYFLNESTTINSLSPIDEMLNYPRMTFDYNLLTCDLQSQEQINETKPLVALSEVYELRSLLKHPFFLVYLDFKWHIIMRNLFYTNLVFFFQLTSSLSFYLGALTYVDSGDNSNLASLFTYIHVFWWIVFFNNGIMFLRELFQLIIYTKANKYRYIKDPNNWMEITLVVIVYIILFGEIHQSLQCRVLRATAIFLSYVELMRLVLSHPTISVHIEMFKAVAFNSLKFLLSYLLLILAFAFSFHILFKDNKLKDNNLTDTNLTDTNLKNSSSTNSSSTNCNFKDLFQATFKTLLMLMGEYDVSNILTNDEYGMSRLIIILFIFLMPIVLFNLLNAIAVNDIQGIRKDAELVSTVARVKLIAHMEGIISALFSMVHYSHALIRGRLGRRKHSCILERKHYYTNYFGTIGYPIKIHVSLTGYGRCVTEKQGCDLFKFPISSSTERSIQEKISAEASKTAEVTQEISALQEICRNLMTLKNELENHTSANEPVRARTI